MNKKQLRKQLEQTLVKTIEDVLSKNNADITKKISKTVQEASKSVAKKFYKSLHADIKTLTTKAKALAVPRPSSSKTPAKKVKSAPKKTVVKSKAKGKK